MAKRGESSKCCCSGVKRRSAKTREVVKVSAAAKKTQGGKQKLLEKFNPRPRSTAETRLALASAGAGASACKIKKVVIDGTEDEGPGFVCVSNSIKLKAKSDPECTAGDIAWTIKSQPTGSSVANPANGDTATITPTKKGKYVIEAKCGDSSDTFDVNSCEIELTAPTQNQEFAINTAPPQSMPVVAVTIADPCPGATQSIRCRFIIGNNGSSMVYEDAPGNYLAPPVLDSDFLAGGVRTWNLPWGQDIYGGHITQIEVRLRTTSGQNLCTKTIPRDVWIIGAAISAAQLSTYLDTLSTLPANNKIMCRAIAKIETDTTQFWWGTGLARAAHNRYPLRERLAAGGYGGGYGLMQLTSANLLNRDTCWNWQRNVDMGLTRIAQAIQSANNKLNAHLPVTDLQIRLEAYAKYNGGNYHVWSGTQWIEDPGYVCGGTCVPRKGRKVVNGQPTGDCLNLAQCYAEFARANE